MTQKAVLYALVALVLIVGVGCVALSIGGHDQDGRSITQFVGFVSVIVMALLNLLRSEVAATKAGQAVTETVKGNQAVQEMRQDVRENREEIKSSLAAAADNRPKGNG